MLRGRVRADAIPDPPAPGWPALYKTVREADVNKVEDCREDIDTLLVFAGLYSAVLTAFVIESYTHLQQDPQDVIIDLLQQIATRNYISGPGFINSTITSTPPPPFEAPLWAIRVNVLWFTSLLLSLASASFGILVKQWLREYLAIEYTVPQQRLRARQYRNPALAQWKVFEIAAFLPLLLQLSLGLFFAGLCFFTSAVHRSVGNTTIPLVSAWVFLLFMMTIAPLFSPRCPFKTTFLKRALRIGRRHVASFFYDLRKTSLELRHTIYLQSTPYLQPIHNVLLYVANAMQIWRAAAARTVSSYWRSLLAFLRRCHLIREPLDPLTQYLESQRRQGYAIQKNKALLEEDEVVKTEAEDVDVLLSVDSLMSDDGLLPIMLDALHQQSEISSAKIFAFISRIVGHRIGQDLDEKRITSIFDLRPLTKLCWSVLTDAIADAFLRHGLGAIDNNAVGRIIDSIIILNSRPNDQLSDHAASTLRNIVFVPMRTPGHACPGGIPLYHCLAQATGALDGVMCLRCVVDAYMTLLCKGMRRNTPDLSLRHVLDKNMPEAFSKGLVQALIRVLASFLDEAISSQKDLAEIPGSHEALYIILQYGKKFGRRDDAVKLCRQMLLTESGTCMLLVQFAALHPQCRVSEDIQELLPKIPWLTLSEDDTRIRSHWAAACERFCNDGDDGDDDVPLDYVRLCARLNWWTGDDKMARAVAKAIEKYYRTQGWRKELQRRDYWCSDALSPTSKDLFKEDQALACKVLERRWSIPTELINALWPFVPHERRVEVLSSIRSDWPDYTPPTILAPTTGQEGSGNGQGGTSVAQGAQEVGDAGQEALEGQDGGGADAMDTEAGGGADVNDVGVRAGDERTESKDTTKREAVEEGIAGDGEDLVGGGGAQGMLTAALN